MLLVESPEMLAVLHGTGDNRPPEVMVAAPGEGAACVCAVGESREPAADRERRAETW